MAVAKKTRAQALKPVSPNKKKAETGSLKPPAKKVAPKKPDLTKEERIKKELLKIRRICKPLPKEKLKAIESLISNAAWMAITLEDLRRTIDINGPVEKYKNGANQYGVKESAAVKTFNSTLKNYTVVIKQLLDQLPDGAPEKDDGFEEFLGQR